MKNKYIGLIMDGNRRWAKMHNFSYYHTYEKSIFNCKEIILSSLQKNVSQLSLYALSYDNYCKRHDYEIADILSLFVKTFSDDMIHFFITHHVLVQFVGRISELPCNVITCIKKIETMTKNYSCKLNLYILFCYDPYKDILHTEENNSLPYNSKNIKPLDIIIRTGNYSRLSGFLPMQSMYANIIIYDVLWPDFTKSMFEEQIEKNFFNNYGS